MEAQIEFKALKVLINATKGFVSSSDRRPIYQYIKIDIDAASGIATASAVDGYRLSVERTACMADESFTVYVKPQLPTGRAASMAVIRLNGKYAYIEVGDGAVGYRQPEGEPFDYEEFISDIESKQAQFRIGFNGAYLLSALTAAKASVGGTFREPVVLEFRGPLSPVLLRTGEANVKAVLPIRLKSDAFDK